MALSMIKEMQQQGYSDEEIIQKLKEQGVSPLEIGESMEQLRIKSALESSPEEMQPSLMDSQEEVPAPQQFEAPQEQYPEQYQMQAYPQYQPYKEYMTTSPETTAEIAEQIAEEKIEKFKKEFSSMQEFKLASAKKIEGIDERLKKIESIIEKLQSAIIGRIGNFGQDIQEIRDEMKMVQESFSKALNPLLENAEPQAEEKKENKKARNKKTDGFENYLR